MQPGSDEEDVYEGVPEDAYLMEDDAVLFNEAEYRADWERDDHQCTLNCNCCAVENEEPKQLTKYLDWGTVHVTETGKEVLRFMSTIMKGKSMSMNKQEDILRCVLICRSNNVVYLSPVLCVVMLCLFLLVSLTSCTLHSYARNEPYPNPHLPATVKSCNLYCGAAHAELTGKRRFMSFVFCVFVVAEVLCLRGFDWGWVLMWQGLMWQGLLSLIMASR